MPQEELIHLNFCWPQFKMFKFSQHYNFSIDLNNKMTTYPKGEKDWALVFYQLKTNIITINLLVRVIISFFKENMKNFT